MLASGLLWNLPSQPSEETRYLTVTSGRYHLRSFETIVSISLAVFSDSPVKLLIFVRFDVVIRNGSLSHRCGFANIVVFLLVLFPHLHIYKYPVNVLNYMPWIQVVVHHTWSSPVSRAVLQGSLMVLPKKPSPKWGFLCVKSLHFAICCPKQTSPDPCLCCGKLAQYPHPVTTTGVYGINFPRTVTASLFLCRWEALTVVHQPLSGA